MTQNTEYSKTSNSHPPSLKFGFVLSALLPMENNRYWNAHASPTEVAALVLCPGSVCGIRFGYIVHINVQQLRKKSEALAIKCNILHACTDILTHHSVKNTPKKINKNAHCATTTTTIPSCINQWEGQNLMPQTCTEANWGKPPVSVCTADSQRYFNRQETSKGAPSPCMTNWRSQT